ncbi:MAG: hypothetical protein ACR2F8_12770 [Caulobacteraceae bacterium]
MTDGSGRHPGRQDEAAVRPAREADAQRRESVMPLIWGLLGVIAIAVFLAALWLHSGRNSKPAAGPAPTVALGGPVKKP